MKLREILQRPEHGLIFLPCRSVIGSMPISRHKVVHRSFLSRPFQAGKLDDRVSFVLLVV